MTKYFISFALAALPLLGHAQQQVPSAAANTIKSNMYAPSVSADNNVIAYFADGTPSNIMLKVGTASPVSITGSLYGGCSRPYVARDGSAVVFYARSSSPTGTIQPYIAESPSWTPTVISTTSNNLGSNYTMDPPTVSDNMGTSGSPLHYVAYMGLNAVGGKNPVIPQIYVWKETTGVSLVASRTSAGVTANAVCYFPVIDATGEHLAFVTTASNLGFGAGGTTTCVFYATYNSGTGLWTTISCPSYDTYSITDATWPSISGNGLIVLFEGDNLTTLLPDIWKWTSATGPAIPYSTAVGVIGNGPHAISHSPCISPDGTAMIFTSNRNFTGSSAYNPYIGPGVGNVGIQTTFIMNFATPWFYLESFDYRSSTAPAIGAQSACVILESSYGSISNPDANGIYHGAFWCAQQAVTALQDTTPNVFIY